MTVVVSCVVKAEVAKSLNLPKLGEARLRGLSAEVVSDETVSARMKMAQGRGFSNVMCAVIENLNYSLILGSDTVEKLIVKMTQWQLLSASIATYSCPPRNCSLIY